MSFLPSARGLSPERIRAYNSETMRLISLYLNLASDVITPAVVTELATACGLSRERAYATLLASVCGLEPDGRDRVYFEEYFVPMVKECDPAPFLADPYYRAVRLPHKKSGRWELRTQVLRPCEAFVRDDFRVLSDGRMLPSLGFFMEEFPYPAVLEGGREWMTLMPNETVTTLPAVRAAHGRVLTFGLGLGYFAFHASEKPEVESVTVVELSADAVALFRENILPLLPHKEKVSIVLSDAFDFLDTMPRDAYDFAFADIWHDVGDGRELYHRFKTYEPRFPHTEFTYWIEDTIRCYERPELWK
ncbi:MAG: hypothetical protein IJF73_05775 [Clostridia bacterium]|nr:hypothetical protein [Clostridia bacterium]